MREPRSALRTVIRTTGANEALRSGDVVPQGIRFDFDDAPPLFAALRKRKSTLFLLYPGFSRPIIRPGPDGSTTWQRSATYYGSAIGYPAN
jgi:hypothetical protein